MTRTTDRGSKVGILVPALNEARSIGTVVGECLAIECASTVLVVDDGSVDATGAIAVRAGATVLRNANKRGLGFSLRRGFRHLREHEFDIVITLDGDGAHDPALIPALIECHFEQRADLTVGTRFLPGKPSLTIPSSKAAANHFATALINCVLGSNFSDVASGMRVFGRKALRLSATSSNFAVAFEVLALSFRNGLRVVEYPIEVRYDAGELFCTNREELLDLVNFALQSSSDNERRSRALALLRERLARYELFVVTISGREVVGHPVPDYNGFVFQMQQPWYSLLPISPQAVASMELP